jgi:DNA-binding Lrp family transcriptional regulator
MSGSAGTQSETEEDTSDEQSPHAPQTILEDRLDEDDYKIFEALNEDGRMSDTELAERVGLSRTAVHRRRENLVDSGILKVLAVVVLQEANLAYADVRISLRSSASSAERNALIEELIDADLIYSVDSVLGDHDLFVRGWHSSLGELKSYFWKLLEDETIVADYEITPVVDTWKAWDRKLDRPGSKE